VQKISKPGLVASNHKDFSLALNQGFDYREQVDRAGAGVTVLAYLSKRYRHSTEAQWLDRIEEGRVLLDGLVPDPGAELRAGQWLVWRRPPWNEPDVPLCFAVLYEDEDLLGVAKPGGLPTVPAGGFMDHTLLALVRKRYPEATPIHRLGRGTSGVVLFARTARARSALTAALRAGEIVKVYRALACGRPGREVFSIDSRIGQVTHSVLGTVHAACKQGKRAVSRVRVLEYRGKNSLLEVQIETGRPHQIRIHLAAAGYPLVGDPLYCAGGGIRDQEKALPGDLGYALHAEGFIIRHPATGTVLQISCAPPPELRVNLAPSCRHMAGDFQLNCGTAIDHDPILSPGGVYEIERTRVDPCSSRGPAK
jgi:23S rRNA pseudouridine1911/1915/1917 synthase